MERRLGTCFSLSLRNFISLFLDITIVSLVFLNLNYSMVVPVNVDLDRVAYLRTLYYSWSAIARMLGVSRSYLYKRTHGNSAFSNPHRSLTDEELEVVRAAWLWYEFSIQRRSVNSWLSEKQWFSCSSLST